MILDEVLCTLGNLGIRNLAQQLANLCAVVLQELLSRA